MSFPNWWAPGWEIGSDADPDTRGQPSIRGSQYSVKQVSSANEAQTQAVDLEVIDSLGRDLVQIRSRERVRDLAEVFTQERDIRAMFSHIADAFESLDIKFLEPSCGSGNFLVEILDRKLLLVSFREAENQERYEHSLIRALASIYGIDISCENTAESRARLARTILRHYQRDAPKIEPTRGFLGAVEQVLEFNIVQGNSLTGVADIEFCDWVPISSYRFRRVWSPAMVAVEDRDLFWGETVQDAEPVHYSRLGETTKSKKSNEFRLG